MRNFPALASWRGAAGSVVLTTIVCASPIAAQTDISLWPQTHYSQGWDLHTMQMVLETGSGGFRDGVSWATVETGPQTYDMSSIAPYMAQAEALGLKVMLVFAGSHPAHDDGNTPFTDEGRQAFARYVAAVVAAFPKAIGVIEIGNEYNTGNFLDGPVKEDPGGYFGPIIKAVDAELKAQQLDVEVLCTGAHSVATGYFEAVFDSGALEHCDALSFHPYRDTPEHVTREIARLRTQMQQRGVDLPLYATEFGNWFETPTEAPDYMLKMVSLLGDAGVRIAVWYALLDEKWWPNMGLFDNRLAPKPAAASFDFLQKRLLSLGRPSAQGTRGEDRIFAYGQDGRGFVVWGAPGTLVVNGMAEYFDSSGRTVAPVTEITTEPVIILGNDLTVGIQRDVGVYDAVLGFGETPWSYHGLTRGGELTPFTLQDGNWNPYIGHAFRNPMGITPAKVATAFFGDEAHYAVERFTAPQAGQYRVSARWYKGGDAEDNDGADIKVFHNGDTVLHEVVRDRAVEWQSEAFALEAGDHLDFGVGPNKESGGDWVRREISVQGPLP